eukprot:TRINITY_DN14914_c0_g1_i1.p1 TRINITY_DN14914_c0_g1~~TRINITY_DN14914_c0_g1_i1.p1  ORF type:complete len:51 (-),score=3.26 TRINITY_DN14914_c0_g1_i1:70-222(-)
MACSTLTFKFSILGSTIGAFNLVNIINEYSCILIRSEFSCYFLVNEKYRA